MGTFIPREKRSYDYQTSGMGDVGFPMHLAKTADASNKLYLETLLELAKRVFHKIRRFGS